MGKESLDWSIIAVKVQLCPRGVLEPKPLQEELHLSGTGWLQSPHHLVTGW